MRGWGYADRAQWSRDPATGKGERSKYQPYEDWQASMIDKRGQQTQSTQAKKARNEASDFKQYQKYKEILKSEAPDAFEKFQGMKYDGSDEREALKDHYYVKSRLADGRWTAIINPEKQAPHMESTRRKGASYFYDEVDVQALVSKYAGTGYVERSKSGKKTNKEIINISEDIGIVTSDGKKFVANQLKIHYSKNRTHIVPRRRK